MKKMWFVKKLQNQFQIIWVWSLNKQIDRYSSQFRKPKEILSSLHLHSRLQKRNLYFFSNCKNITYFSFKFAIEELFKCYVMKETDIDCVLLLKIVEQSIIFSFEISDLLDKLNKTQKTKLNNSNSQIFSEKITLNFTKLPWNNPEKTHRH